MDADVARMYAKGQIDGLKTSFVMELIRLHVRGPMTITELAESVQRSHLAISQQVAAMSAADLVRTTVGADTRSRTVTVTAKATSIIGRISQLWMIAARQRVFTPPRHQVRPLGRHDLGSFRNHGLPGPPARAAAPDVRRPLAPFQVLTAVLLS
jgi:DNA-binding MarR family transcriptional regulator